MALDMVCDYERANMWLRGDATSAVYQMALRHVLHLILSPHGVSVSPFKSCQFPSDPNLTFNGR